MKRQQMKWVVLIAAIATVGACSFKTYYNRLDVLVEEYVEGRVTLDDALEQKLKQHSQALLDWHRNTQLKDYARWLRGVQLDVGSQTTEAMVGQRTDEVMQFWETVLTKLNDEMAQLLPLLDAKRTRELFANIEKDNQAFRKESLQLSDRKRSRQLEKLLRENYENWIGGLTYTQGRLVRRAAQGIVSIADYRLQHRYEWQGGIRAILAADTSAEEKTERLRVFLNGFEGSHRAALDRKWDANRRIIVRLTVDLAHSLTAKQRAFFKAKTDDYIRMFTELAENR